MKDLRRFSSVVCFGFGIALAPSIPEWGACLTATAFGLAGLALFSSCQNRRRRGLSALCLGVGLVLAGELARAHEDARLDAPLEALPPALRVESGDERVVRLSGVFEEDPERSEGMMRALVRSTRIEDRGIVSAFETLVPITWPVSPEDPERLDYAGRVVSASVRLRRPHNFGNPGGFDSVSHFRRRGVVVLGFIKSPRVMTVEPLPIRGSVALFLRRRFDRILSRIDGHEGSDLSIPGSVLRASLLGGRAGLSEETERALVASGVYHVLAISGLQVAVLGGCLFVVLRRLAIPEGWAVSIALVATIVYGHVATSSPSVRRAVFTAILAGAARIIHRRTPGIAQLATIALLGLALHPLDLFDPGFQLTFGATAGILLFAPRLRSRIQARWGLSSLVSASLAAQGATLFLVAYWFHRVVPYGLASNLLAVPLGSIAVVLGILVLPVDLLSERASSAIGTLAEIAVRCLLAVASVPVEGTVLSFRVAPPGPLTLGAVSLSLLILAGSRRKRSLVAGAFLFVLAACTLVMQGALGPGTPDIPSVLPGGSRGGVASSSAALTIDVLDVGQGDAILVGFPDGETMLVDGGGIPGSSFDIGARVLAPELERRGLFRLGRIVLTHAHEDHGGGLREILRSFEVGELLSPDALEGTLREDLETAARSRGTRALRIRRGYTIREGDTTITCLAPFPGAMDGPNSDSLVLRVAHGTRSIVLTGDIGAATETRLVAAGLGPADVLKVPHHGSARSSSRSFLSALSPRVAIISVGDANRFGHPSRETLGRLAEQHALVLRTDRDGCIKVALEGDGLFAGSLLIGKPLPFPGPPLRGARTEPKHETSAIRSISGSRRGPA